ncbi:hypothetical protein KFE25_004549 [Diacronema lutheri]|uniref:Mediator of RNA polymerase II transcription subunit 6 n=1 Tax=Diacronema lutheri TaxID=2081491 RepID=A0A8J6C8E6_DIALT|nr:hypothetical protein KFE25_004549 [Diacronema lutheri]
MAEIRCARGDPTLEVEHFDPNWRLPLPGGEPRLSALTALAYFGETTFGSPGFYEPDCDNELAARSPGVQRELAQTNEREAALFEPGRWSFAEYAALREHRAAAIAVALRELRGHQFELVPALTLEAGEHRAYVIQKVRRTSRIATQSVAAYTVIDGVIRRSPDLYALVESRLAKAAYHLGRVVAAADELDLRRRARAGLGGAPAGLAHAPGTELACEDARDELRLDIRTLAQPQEAG